MTSFATDDVVRAHVAEKGLGEPLWFCQTAAPRLQPDGSVFVEEDGRRRSTARVTATSSRRFARPGTLAELQRRGVRTIVVSNVDNLGARLDPVVVGMHALAGTPLTVEVVAKGDDTGGAPARVDGRPQLLEAMRFPPDFDQSRIPVFNTNTVADRRSTRSPSPIELTWLVVEKMVDGRAGGAVRAALSRALGPRSDDVPRRAAPRPARAFPAGQGAGGSRSRCNRSCGRCWRVRPPRQVDRRGLSGTVRDGSVTYRRSDGSLVDSCCLARCGICRKVGNRVCERCRARLVRCVPPWCERCGAPGPGRCGGAPSAPAGGSRSRAPALRSSTRTGARRSSPPGRNVAPGPRRGQRPARDVEVAARGRLRRRRHSFPATATGSNAATPRQRLALELARRWSCFRRRCCERRRGVRRAARAGAGRAAPRTWRGRRGARRRARACLPRRRRLHDGCDRDEPVRLVAPARGGRDGRRRVPRRAVR